MADFTRSAERRRVRLERIEEIVAAGERGSVVTRLCDTGERYAQSYCDDDWLLVRMIDWHAVKTL